MNQKALKKFHRSKASIVLAFYVSTFLLLTLFIVQQYKAPLLEKQDQASKIAADKINYFKSLPIQAKAVYVFDTKSNTMIFGKNEHIPLPLASITKIMTSLCALDTLGPDHIVTIEKTDVQNEGRKDLIVGEQMKVSNLVSLTLVESSNDGADALGREVSREKNILSCMNEKAETYNLFETAFYNDTGLDIGGKAGAYGSAENAAALLEIAFAKYPSIFGKTRYGSYTTVSTDGVHSATNTNKVSEQIVGMQASKTGLTDLAGGNLVFTMDVGLNHTVVIAILGSTQEGRFRDALYLSNAVIDTISNE